jgi:hypothetical protein
MRVISKSGIGRDQAGDGQQIEIAYSLPWQYLQELELPTKAERTDVWKVQYLSKMSHKGKPPQHAEPE